MPPRRSPAAAATAGTSTLPPGAYRKYKRATECFKNWLWQAYTTGVGAGGGPKGDYLEFYERIVKAIAREPTSLAPSQLRFWKRATEACQTAITVRTQAMLCFPAQTESAYSHARFIAKLKSWLELLQTTERPPVHVEHTAHDVDLDFSNYYEVLSLPDDYFAEVDDTVWTQAALPDGVQRLTEADRKRLFDEAFTEDLDAELACLFMELEELSETVYSTYFAVKQQTKTLVEATAVAKIAIDSAASVIAKLQLRYPSIRDTQDIMSMIQDRVPAATLKEQMVKVMKAWYPTERNGATRSQYVPGTLLVDVMWVARTLLSFVATIPANARTQLVVREGFFGDTYSEEDTPHYTMPDMTSKPAFLLQQLPLLFNVMVANHASGIETDTTSFHGWFLDQFDRSFTTRTVSIN